ncbi:MAG: acetolactate synthase small subunit [Candidatus Hydrogenedentes bacterium]|nr:acetolactate synthase small subunit [Candidatus Hydrogenedentota bacterium]
MLHTISVLVDNHFGVLSRISGLFSARGYNIESLCVGVTQDPSISRMTVVVRGDDNVLQQIVNQLNKLVEVIQVLDLTQESFVERELVLIKADADAKRRTELLEIANIFRAKVVDMSMDTIIVEVTGTEDKVGAFIDMIRPFGIRELARSGRLAMARSKNGTEAGAGGSKAQESRNS